MREARRSGQRGSLDRSEGERRAAKRPADQPESEGKRPSALAASQRDNFVELHRRLSLECPKTVKKLCKTGEKVLDFFPGPVVQ